MTDVAFHLDELEELAAAGGREFVKDQRKIEHLLQRMLGTIRQYKAQISQLSREVRELQTNRDRAGMATTLSPMDAFQYLSDEQRQIVFGVIARNQLAWLREKTAEANQAGANANVLLGRVRAGCVAIMNDPTLPPAVRERFGAYLAGAPADAAMPGPVDVPTGPGSPFEHPPVTTPVASPFPAPTVPATR